MCVWGGGGGGGDGNDGVTKCVIEEVRLFAKSISLAIYNDIFLLQILPSLVEMLKEYPGQNLKLCLPCLQFIYWSLVHVEQTQGQQVCQSRVKKVEEFGSRVGSGGLWGREVL